MSSQSKIIFLKVSLSFSHVPYRKIVVQPKKVVKPEKVVTQSYQVCIMGDKNAFSNSLLHTILKPHPSTQYWVSQK